MRHNYYFLAALSLPVIATSLSGSFSSSVVKNVVVVGGTHGNEYTGVWCIKALDKAASRLSEQYPSLDISTLLANPQAHFENKRFVDDDLNRQFSHELLHGIKEEDGLPETVESLRAREINEILGPKFAETHSTDATDVVIDLHSTTSNMGLSVIIAEGDPLMAQAAAFLLHKCEGEQNDVRVLMHADPSREARPNLPSTGRHGFTIEVGPVPQGLIRHDAVEKTDEALYALLEFFERRNNDNEALSDELRKAFKAGRAPCFRSASAKRAGEMSGKIPWPCDAENENFPALMVHKDLQDRDFRLIKTGDPLFVDLKGNTIPYSGSHGSPVYLMFVNEGGYYFASSGTGIAVAVRAAFDLETGASTLLEEESECVTAELSYE
jgi:succinylglutamate desuccinylase